MNSMNMAECRDTRHSSLDYLHLCSGELQCPARITVLVRQFGELISCQSSGNAPSPEISLLRIGIALFGSRHQRCVLDLA